MRWLPLVAGLAFVLPGPAQAEDPTIEELLNAVDDSNRGESSQGRMTMNVKTRRWERSLSMEMWSRCAYPCCIRSSNRPGVATSKSGLRRRARIWAAAGTPPSNTALRRGKWRP